MQINDKIFIHCGKTERCSGVRKSVKTEYAAQGWILRVGSVRRNLVRRSPGYDELSGKYDPALKRWSLETLPFLPENFKYEVIPEVKKQFTIVSNLLHREDIETIYVCTDSGREGEYIYRLVAQMAGIKDKKQKRVWIDSQTEEEILRGIREAKDESEYDNLSASAYLRAKEDYLMGINFSRLLSLKYGSAVASYLGTKYQSISVGRVMTCVLGMVVRREREIRSFVKTPFYRVIAGLSLNGRNFEGEWRAVKGSRYFNSPLLYKENGFQKKRTHRN